MPRSPTARLPAERWESYVKLQRELEHLERRVDKRAESEARRRWRTISREAPSGCGMKGRDV